MSRTNNQPNLLIRADASPVIGTGHVMRCLALADAWSDLGGRVTFASQPMPGLLKKRIEDSQYHLHELRCGEGVEAQVTELQELAVHDRSRWIALDGYTFDDEFVRQLRMDDRQVLVIHDDDRQRFPSADALLNQSVFGTPKQPCRHQAQLLGAQYALLRSEFSRSPSGDVGNGGQALRILVTCGGADHDNVTGEILEALDSDSLQGTILDVAVGPCNPHWKLLRRRARESRLDIRLHRNVDRMSFLISRAHFAITAGGSTCYELAHFGVPFIVLPIVANQVPVAHGMQANQVGICIDPDDHQWKSLVRQHALQLANTPNLRREMGLRGRKLVDGCGALRVCRALKTLEIKLWPATLDDAELLFAWRMDEAVVGASFHDPPSTLHRHQQWLQQQINDSHCRCFIVRNRMGEPIGQIRINGSAGKSTGTISLSIDRAWRAQGYATATITLAMQQASQAGLETLIAVIKPDNAASIAAFERAGFRFSGREEINGQPASRLSVDLKNDFKEQAA